MTICPRLPERFFALSSEPSAGFLYARQMDDVDSLCGYVEALNAEWAYVISCSFEGEIGGSCQWRGWYFAVPKGRKCDFGEIVLRAEVFPTDPPTVVISSINSVSSSSFPSRFLVGFTPDFLTPTGSLQAGFEGRGESNLTGRWLGDDGGVYYINDIPGSDRWVVWFGEDPRAEPAAPSGGGARWANVMFGNRSPSDRIAGAWSDVPRGLIDQNGRIFVDILDGETLRVRERDTTGGFGGRVFKRVVGTAGIATLTCEIRWTDITIINQQDRRGIGGRRGDEVALQIAVAKMDGATVDFANLSAATAEIRLFDTGQIASVIQGMSASLSELPPFSADLIPVPNTPTDWSETVLSISVRGIERDRRRVAFAEDWERALQSTLNRRLQAGEPLNVPEAASPILYRGTPLPFGHDDVLGTDTLTFSWTELMAIATIGSRDMAFTVAGQGGRWVIRGTLSVTRIVDRLDRDCSRLRGG